MPKVHNIGANHFVQVLDLPVIWGKKVVVRGWTQEIEEPFRTSQPFLVRLPNYKALAFGKWTGIVHDEEEALNSALQRRDVTYDDFTEEAGWTPAPDSDREESSEDIYSRLNSMDGTLNVHNGESDNRVAEESKQ